MVTSCLGDCSSKTIGSKIDLSVIPSCSASSTREDLEDGPQQLLAVDGRRGLLPDQSSLRHARQLLHCPLLSFGASLKAPAPYHSQIYCLAHLLACIFANLSVGTVQLASVFGFPSDEAQIELICPVDSIDLVAFVFECLFE